MVVDRKESAFVSPLVLQQRRDSLICSNRACVENQPVWTRMFARKPICCSAENLDGVEFHPSATYYRHLFQTPPRVALTREEGKNESLKNLLEQMYSFIEAVEVPCVRTVPLEKGLRCLSRILRADPKPEWIVITSPESAHTFIEIWKKENFPDLQAVKFAAVGNSTADVLRAVGFNIAFIPSKATGKSLISEFPTCDTSTEVVYPASFKASNAIVDGLLHKYGIAVKRIDTYSTEEDLFDDNKLSLCKGSHIVAFAAPSAVRSWAKHVGVDEGMIVACIGETSAQAAKKVGFKRVHYPDRPGLDGWVTAVADAMHLFEQGRRKTPN